MPKVYPVEQGSDDWRKVRLGIPTASQFHKIITPKTGQLSAQARKYAFQLVCEQLLGQPSDDEISALPWIGRGTELEPAAVALYEFETGTKTLPVGFITNDAGTVGCSPDRLVQGVHAGIEVKCPKPETHLGYLIDGFGDDYKCQAQGQIWIANFDWVERYSYHPALPPATVRTNPDDVFIRKLERAMADFLDMRNDILHKVKARGLMGEGGLIEMAR